jgi:ABC-type Fe3+ transport system permease subunit
MKLEAIGALLVRMMSAAFVLRGVTGLVNMAVVYSRLHHAVESNAALKQGFQESVRNSITSAVVALVCGVVAWLLSRHLGRMLAAGLDEAPVVTPAA